MQSRVEHRLLLLARESYRSSSRTPSPPVTGVETLSRMTLLIQNLPSNPRTATPLDSARDPGLLRPARLRSAGNGRPDRREMDFECSRGRRWRLEHYFGKDG